MFEKITENVEIHQTLPDTPNMTTQELKKNWDKGNRIIKEAFNGFIDKLNSTKITINKVLYDNSKGTIETITLSENVSEFDYLEIYYRRGEEYEENFVKVAKPDGKKVSLINSFFFLEQDLIQLEAKVVKISGNTIKPENDGYINFKVTGVESMGNVLQNKKNSINIIKVVGYKEVNYEQL